MKTKKHLLVLRNPGYWNYGLFIEKTQGGRL